MPPPPLPQHQCRRGWRRTRRYSPAAPGTNMPGVQIAGRRALLLAGPRGALHECGASVGIGARPTGVAAAGAPEGGHPSVRCASVSGTGPQGGQTTAPDAAAAAAAAARAHSSASTGRRARPCLQQLWLPGAPGKCASCHQRRSSRPSKRRQCASGCAHRVHHTPRLSPQAPRRGHTA